jgi:Protein of unknown function (DUF3108)
MRGGRILWLVAALLCTACLVGAADSVVGGGPAWVQSLTTTKPVGSFPPLPSLHARYRFGWSGLSAASADVRFTSTDEGYSLDATGGTSGLARTLYPLDVTHHSVGDRTTLRPAHVAQTEKYRNETVQTAIDFKSNEVTSLRKTNPQKSPPKTQTFDAAPAFDLMSALLWLRSQPLNNGDHESLVAYPSNAPYLASITVTGREKIRIAGTERNAIRLDLSLKAIDKQLRLKQHKRFKTGRGWISDDDLRIPLRIEADIFIGYVFAELEGISESQ